MAPISVYTIFFLLYSHWFIIKSLSQGHGTMEDNKVLYVGEELRQETLPLKMGSRVYELHGLKSSRWYEVKISYPASIPSRFSVQLKRGKSEHGRNWQRKLLNTEKLIFEADGLNLVDHQGGIYVLVNVEPEGVVAIPHVSERDFVIFNIVCDELLLGIPHKAWWVVGMVVLCLALAFVAPYHIPWHLLENSQRFTCVDPTLAKDS